MTLTLDGALFNRINTAGQFNARGLSGEIAFRLRESFIRQSPNARLDLETMAEAMALGFQIGVIRWARIQEIELREAVADRSCIVEGLVSALQNVWQNAPGDDRSNEALREAMDKRLPL